MKTPKKPYDFCDKQIAYLRQYIVRQYFLLRNTVLGIDEIHRLGGSHVSKTNIKKINNAVEKCYEMIVARAKICYIAIYNHYYEKYSGKEPKDFDILEYLMMYDPVCKYIFTNEIERKKSRCAEAVISSENPVKELDYSKRLLGIQIEQQCINLTDSAVLDGYRALGYKKVKWITMGDSRVCDTCRARHGKIYPIDKVPPKAHIGCRCWKIPVK